MSNLSLRINKCFSKIDYNKLTSDSVMNQLMKYIVNPPGIPLSRESDNSFYYRYIHSLRVINLNELMDIERDFIKYFREFVDKFNKLYNQSYDCTRLLDNLDYNYMALYNMSVASYSCYPIERLCLQPDVLMFAFECMDLGKVYDSKDDCIKGTAYHECLHLFDWLVNYKSKGISPKDFMEVANHSEWFESEYNKNLGSWRSEKLVVLDKDRLKAYFSIDGNHSKKLEIRRIPISDLKGPIM